MFNAAASQSWPGGSWVRILEMIGKLAQAYHYHFSPNLFETPHVVLLVMHTHT